MKTNKKFYGNQYTDIGTYKIVRKKKNSKWESVKRFFRRLFKTLFFISITALIVYAIYETGAYTGKDVVYTKQEVIKEVPMKASIMDKIAKCESGASHYAKNGQVLVVGNTNKSVDVGYYQINQQIWGATATAQGLNIFVEEDNKKFAEQYLFPKYGSEPWVFSKNCWR